MIQTHTPKYRSHRRNKTKRILFVILLILLLFAVGFGIWFFISGNDTPAEFLVPVAGEQAEVQKNEDTISVPGYEGLTLKADSKKQDLSLKNPAENTCYFVITLYLEDGTELWKSEMIKAGDVSKPIRLNRALSAGNYPAKLKYECYRMDREKTPLNGAEVKLTLRVK